MDDFNAKKARARKLKQDKYHGKPRKHVDSSSTKAKSSKEDASGVGKPLTNDSNLRKANESHSEISSDEGSEDKFQSFSKRKLASNWDRYEEPLTSMRPDEDSDDTGAQFEELLSMPTSGGHLKFKHEQEWEKEKSELQTPWFQLDIQSLEKNLSTIPFFTRQNLPLSLFSEAQLQRLITRAQQNATSLLEVNESLLKIQSISLSNREKGNTNVIEKPAKTEVVVDGIKPSSEEKQSIISQGSSVDDHDLDELLLQENSSKLSTTKSEGTSVTLTNEGCQIPDVSRPEHPVSSSEASSQPSVSLDDWLDSILDD